ncbi:hypothetical protein Tco_1164835 [Tanacetum coccineum]
MKNDSSSSELFNSVFDSRSSDGDNNQTNDRFKKDNGYHAVPPPLTRNYMPPLADLSFAGLDDSVYRPTTNKISASVSQVEKSTSQTSNTSVEMLELNLLGLVELSLKIGNESVKPKQAEKPSIITQNPKVDRRDWKGKMTQKLRMAKKSVLKNMGKNTVQREIKPVWNNAQRINHQNKFVLSAVLTRISNEKVNTVRVNGVNTAGQTAVSVVKEIGATAVKASAGYV